MIMLKFRTLLSPRAQTAYPVSHTYDPFNIGAATAVLELEPAHNKLAKGVYSLVAILFPLSQ